MTRKERRQAQLVLGRKVHRGSKLEQLLQRKLQEILLQEYLRRNYPASPDSSGG